MMAKYVVGLFEDPNDAQAVESDLRSAGFSSSNVELHSGNASGVISRLTDAGIPDEDANVYAEGVRRGGSLVTVYTESDDQAYQAADIMNRHNIVDIDRLGQEYRAGGWTRYDETAGPYETTGTAYAGTTGTTDYDRTAATAGTTGTVGTTDVDYDRTTATTGTTGTTDQGETAVPIVEEELRVGKRETDRGGVRVDTRVEETPVEEQVNLRDETVSVERRRVDQPVTDADATAFQEGAFEVREQGEEAIVDKQARVVEEVVVRKDVEDRTETVQDTVRRTDVDVENLSGQSRSSNFTDRIEGTTGADIDRDGDVAGRPKNS
jgi:uncharacterized protein (TIGR02271 family)